MRPDRKQQFSGEKMRDIVKRLRDMQCEEPCSPDCCIDKTRAEAADEIERLRAIEMAARALQFSAYPAHGSGFVTVVSGGNINDLERALNQQLTAEQ